MVPADARETPVRYLPLSAMTSRGGPPVPAAYPGAPGHGGQASSAEKDGLTWRFGTKDDVAWIQAGISVGLEITSAIPPVFDAYATVIVSDDVDRRAADFSRLVGILREESPAQPWWLGYLDTGADDVVFHDARMVELISSWWYVLVEAGPDQALQWRQEVGSWRSPGADLIFPADRSWLVSWLWDDDWRCIGGSAALIARLLAERSLQARQVHSARTPPRPGTLPADRTKDFVAQPLARAS